MIAALAIGSLLLSALEDSPEGDRHQRWQRGFTLASSFNRPELFSESFLSDEERREFLVTMTLQVWALYRKKGEPDTVKILKILRVCKCLIDGWEPSEITDYGDDGKMSWLVTVGDMFKAGESTEFESVLAQLGFWFVMAGLLVHFEVHLSTCCTSSVALDEEISDDIRLSQEFSMMLVDQGPKIQARHDIVLDGDTVFDAGKALASDPKLFDEMMETMGHAQKEILIEKLMRIAGLDPYWGGHRDPTVSDLIKLGGPDAMNNLTLFDGRFPTVFESPWFVETLEDWARISSSAQNKAEEIVKRFDNVIEVDLHEFETSDSRDPMPEEEE